MQPRTHLFPTKARRATQDNELQAALNGLATGFVARRQTAIADCPEFESLREVGRDIRTRTFSDLETYLVAFEKNAARAGSQVHWAETGRDACVIATRICREAGARLIVKGKSMVSEEIGLNAYLESSGYEVVETDLGEYLLQLRDETPSHIIAPAIHLNEKTARDTFLKAHDTLDPNRDLETPESIVGEARNVLRQKFRAADVGITGANFLIADTGSAVVVTNEGNGDLTATLPKVHIIIASLDKVVPTLREASVLLKLLARSATGQAMTAYTSIFTGPKQTSDIDGPDACHIIIVDNGRSDLLASDASEVLNCIRCGACLNHCPIYTTVGGHSYGWVYPGPIGAALNPGLLGVAQTRNLPHASTLCGRCEAVCPVKIPLPKLLRQWRAQDFATGQTTRTKLVLIVWRWLVQRPKFYRIAADLIARTLKSKRGRHRAFPFARGWTAHRDLPAVQGQSFLTQWQKHDTSPTNRKRGQT